MIGYKHSRFAIVTLAASLAAGCGGGGSHSAPATLVAPATSAPAAIGSARFTLTIPSRTASGNSRRGAYVSASAQSAVIVANPGAISTTVNFTGTNCVPVTGGQACTIVASARIGADTFAMTLWDNPGGTGNVLGGASSFAATITEGSSNVTAPLVLGGVPTSADVTASTLTAGQATTVPLVVTAYDHGGNIIVGTGSYVDTTGTATPLTVALAIAPFGNQVVLHNGVQNGSSITVAGPTDSPTIQLSAPANVLGIPFTVTGPGAVRLSAHAAQYVGVTGTLTAANTFAYPVGATDYNYFAPSNTIIAPGMPNGFVFSMGSQSFGISVGDFDTSTETVAYCTSPGFYRDVAPVSGGLAYFYAVDYNTDNPPEGLGFVPASAFTGGGCPLNQYLQNAAGARGLVFDAQFSRLFEGNDDGALRYDSFSSPNLSGRTLVDATIGGTLGSLVTSLSHRRFFLTSANATKIYSQINTAVATSLAPAGGSAVHSLAMGYDDHVYAVDTNGKVFEDDGVNTNSFAPLPFNYAPPSQPWHLALGPDGNAYADISGSRFLQQLTPAGNLVTIPIPAPQGNGNIRAIFDGHNGYEYVVLDDTFNSGNIDVIRVSY